MEKRLEDKVAIVVGAGQTPGDTIGNGRAISVLFAREGATVMAIEGRSEALGINKDDLIKMRNHSNIPGHS